MLKAVANWWGDSDGSVDLPAITQLSSGVPGLRGEVFPATISVKDVREDAPKFKRAYSATVTRGIKVTVTIYNSYGATYSGGELTQPNGRWILFDPDRIADKIIDPALLPEVESTVRDIKALDRSWRQSQPTSFIDERGTKWIRA